MNLEGKSFFYWSNRVSVYRKQSWGGGSICRLNNSPHFSKECNFWGVKGNLKAGIQRDSAPVTGEKYTSSLCCQEVKSRLERNPSWHDWWLTYRYWHCFWSAVVMWNFEKQQSDAWIKPVANISLWRTNKTDPDDIPIVPVTHIIYVWFILSFDLTLFPLFFPLAHVTVFKGEE